MGWWDSVFGPPPQPAHPASREAAFGRAYAGLPVSSNIDDRRQQGSDYAVAIKKAPPSWTQDYWPSDIKGGVDPWGTTKQFNGFDPLVASPLIATGRKVDDKPVDAGAYAPSYQQNMKPPRGGSFPSNFNIPSPSYGPSGLPYIGEHLPISPGDPGWTPPTSPPRATPGMTLNSWGWQ